MPYTLLDDDLPKSKYQLLPDQDNPTIEKPSFGENLLRQAGLTARAGLSGLAALPVALSDAVGGLYNTGADLISGKGNGYRFPFAGNTVQNGLTAIGLPAPKNKTENVIQDIAGSMAGQGELIKAAGLVNSASPAVNRVASLLGINPASQIIGAGGAAGGSGVARENGAGAIGQAAAGIAGGFVAPLAADATLQALRATGRGVRAAIDPFTQAGRNQVAGSALNNLATDPQTAIQNLSNVPEYVPGSAPTTAQAAKDEGLLIAERGLSSSNPQAAAKFARRSSEQNTARNILLQGLAGDEDTLANAQQARTDETAPMRQSALDNANLGSTKTLELQNKIADKYDLLGNALQDQGRFSTTAAQQKGLSENFTPVTGQPRVSSRYSNNSDRVPEATDAAYDAGAIASQRRSEKAFAQYQLDSLQQHGYFPLKSDSIVSGIDAIMNQPGLRASDVVQKSLGALKDKILGLTDENGIIDSRNLYTVRKELGNTIEGYAKETNNWDKRLTGGLQSSIQGKIDDVIESSGGTGWKDYLAKYSELSKPIDQQQALQGVQAKVLNPGTDAATGERLMSAAKFSNVLNNPQSRAQLKNVLSDDQFRTLDNISADLNRGALSASSGRSAGSNTAQNFSTAYVLGNALGNNVASSGIVKNLARPLSWLNKLNEPEVHELITDAMLNPGLAKSLMSNATPRKVESIGFELLQRARANGIGAAVGIGQSPVKATKQ